MKNFLIDLFRNYISPLKWPFSPSLLQNFSTVCTHMLSKFFNKSARKWLIFPSQANYERGLILFCALILPLSGFATNGPNEGPVVVVIATRPDAIKMIPVYQALKEENIPTVLCSTGQHAELLQEVLTLFDVKPDIDFKIMKPDQDLFYITESVLEHAKVAFKEINPSLVLVQGDTTSAASAALAAFYLKIPVGHVEAGLRSGNMYGPFPEEMNRRMISMVANLHFAPTQLAASHLIDEKVDKNTIFCTGNTVIDAFQTMKSKMAKKELVPTASLQEKVEFHQAQGHRIVLMTAHRRESFGGGLQQIFQSVKKALEENPNLFVIYPVHPNPSIRKALEEVQLDKMPNIFVTTPLNYKDLVYVLDHATGVATDSGGIQEEAVSLNKPTLVLRKETDRQEGIVEGIAELVGTEEAKILKGFKRIMEQKQKASSGNHLYGDGSASKRIATLIKRNVYKKTNAL